MTRSDMNLIQIGKNPSYPTSSTWQDIKRVDHIVIFGLTFGHNFYAVFYWFVCQKIIKIVFIYMKKIQKIQKMQYLSYKQWFVIGKYWLARAHWVFIDFDWESVCKSIWYDAPSSQ